MLAVEEPAGIKQRLGGHLAQGGELVELWRPGAVGMFKLHIQLVGPLAAGGQAVMMKHNLAVLAVVHLPGHGWLDGLHRGWWGVLLEGAHATTP